MKCHVKNCDHAQVPGSSFCALHSDHDVTRQKLPKKIPSRVQDILMGRREVWISGIKDAGRTSDKRKLKQFSIRLSELDEVIECMKREGLWNG